MVYRGTESSMMNFLRIELLWTLLFVGPLQASVHNEQKNITAESGQDVTLTCRAPNNKNDLVEWSRADLGDEYVLLYRDGHFLPDDQHPSFKNRVDLQDRQMKDGDVSLILKDVTINDTGTYECHVKREGDSIKLISIISLSVVDPPGQPGGATEDAGKKDGSVGLKVGLPVVVFLLVVGGAFVGCWNFRKDKPQTQDSHRPPSELQIEMSESFLNSESPADEHRDRNDSKANNCHQHSTRIPDVTLTLENELVRPLPTQETAGLLPERRQSAVDNV